MIDELREVCYNADNKNSRDTIKYERWKMKREQKTNWVLETPNHNCAVRETIQMLEKTVNYYRTLQKVKER